MQTKRRPSPPAFDPKTNEPVLNWTKTSNRLVDYLYPAKVSGSIQLALMLHIARETWGNKEKTVWCKLSINQLSKKFRATRQGITNAIEDAERRGILEMSTGKKNTAKLCRLTQWKHIPDYEQPHAAAVEPAEHPQATEPRHRMIVLPGHHSTVTLEVIRPDGEIEELPFDWHNGTDTRQSISVDFVAGRIVVKAEKADAKAERTEGETVPSPLGNFSAVSSPAFDENTELIQIQGVKQVSAVSSPQKDAHAKQNGKAQKGGRKTSNGTNPDLDGRPPAVFADPRTDEYFRQWTDYRQFLDHLVLNAFGKVLDQSFFERIMARVGKTPLWIFQKLVGHRIGNGGRDGHSTGLLLVLADDARAGWKAREALNREAAHMITRAIEKRATAPPRPPLNKALRWDRIRSILRERLAEVVYANWFEASRQITETKEATIIEVPDEVVARFVEDEYGPLLARVCLELGEPAVFGWRCESSAQK